MSRTMTAAMLHTSRSVSSYSFFTERSASCSRASAAALSISPSLPDSSPASNADLSFPSKPSALSNAAAASYVLYGGIGLSFEICVADILFGCGNS